MLRHFFKSLGLSLVVVIMSQTVVFAQSAETEPDSPQTATFKSRCANLPDGHPPCATSPAECGSQYYGFHTVKSNTEANKHETYWEYKVPINCLFLQEPIGGKTGYDLYKLVPMEYGDVQYVLWYGEVLVGDEQGPFQAILAYEEGKESQGPFGLLYNYLGLVYNFMSGIIIAFVVLVAIIGGIRMSTSAGDQDAYGKGRSMIIKALVGMAIWFTASVILYTINPTFFTF